MLFVSSPSFKIKIIFFFRFNGRNIEIAKSTTFKHERIYHLAKYLGKPLTTGSDGYLSGHAKTEIMNLENGEWESGPDYPFHKW